MDRIPGKSLKIGNRKVSDGDTFIEFDLGITNNPRMRFPQHGSDMEMRVGNAATYTSMTTVLGLPPRMTAAEGAITALEAADISLDSRIDAIEGSAVPDVANFTYDLWEWDVAYVNVTTLANNSGNLQWSRTFTHSVNNNVFNQATPFSDRYWELLYILGSGLSLKIIDGAGAVWLITPVSTAAYSTHVTLSGTNASSGTHANVLGSSGIGVVYNVYKDSVSQANFSTFTTRSSFDANAFRVVIFGTKSVIYQRVNGIGIYPALPRKFFRRLLAAIPSANLSGPATYGFKITFVVGKRYRVSIMNARWVSQGSRGSYSLKFHNHISATTEDKLIGFPQWMMEVTSSEVQSWSPSFEFIAMENDINFLTGGAMSFGNTGLISTGDFSLNYWARHRALPVLFVEEIF